MIALVRHAEYQQPSGTLSAWSPYPLTPVGQEQCALHAASLVKFVQARGVRVEPVIDCSLMLRAWQTASLYAEHLASALGGRHQIEQFPALAERGIGALANLTIEEIERVMALDPRVKPLPAGWKRQPDFVLPVQGAESLLQAGSRVAHHIRERCGSGDALKIFVGHGGSLRHAAYHLGMLTEAELPRLSMSYAEPVVFERDAAGSWRRVFGAFRPRDELPLEAQGG